MPSFRGDVDAATCGVCGCVGNHSPYVAVPCGHVFCYYCIAQHIVSGLPPEHGAHRGRPPEPSAKAPVVRCCTCFRRVTAIAPLRVRLQV